MYSNWKILKEIYGYLPPAASSYTIRYVIISSALAILDVVALMLLALSMTSMMRGEDIAIPGFTTVGPAGYMWVILVVSFLIILRSLLSLVQQWFASRRFAKFELTLGNQLFDAYIRTPWVDRLSKTSSHLVRMVDVGVAAIIGGFVLPAIGLPAMVVTTVLIIATLFIVEPITAVVTLAYLGAFLTFLYVLLSRKTLEAGAVNQRYSYRLASLMTDMVGAMKEIALRNKASEVAVQVNETRSHATRARANLQFLGAVPKFVLDAALIGGFVLVGGVSYLIDGEVAAAIAAVAMFAVAGVRIIPSMVTFQAVVNTLNYNAPQVQSVLDDLDEAEKYQKHQEQMGQEPLEGQPDVLNVENVTFTYPSRTDPALNNVSLTIPIGSSVGLVGESGSGKTTLVDVLLGLLVPQEGTIWIGDQNMEDVLAAWRERVGYVPQEVSLFDGTIAQNVALTWTDDIDVARVELALKRAQLWDVVMERKNKLQTRIGERGIAFSGGQRQRLGIARALYTDPLVLILDEATSALDNKTESKVSDAIQSLHGEVTVVQVAHRLSTIKDADLICYLEDGFVVATGSFNEVADLVPAFAEQARLAGLR